MRGKLSRRPLAVLCVVALALTACGSSGRELRDPPDGAVAPIPTTTVPQTAAPPIFQITSPLLSDPNQSLPPAFVCDDAMLPPLLWEGIPEGTAELAVSIINVIDDGYVHLLVTSLAPIDGTITNDYFPADAVYQPGSGGVAGWDPPCPEGDETIELSVTLYAMPFPLDPPIGGVFEETGPTTTLEPLGPTIEGETDTTLSVSTVPGDDVDPQAWLAAIESTLPTRAAFTMLVRNP